MTQAWPGAAGPLRAGQSFPGGSAWQTGLFLADESSAKILM